MAAMRSKFIEWLEASAETMSSELFQAKAIIITFGALGLCCLIGAFWNPWQLLLAVMCAAMVLCGIQNIKSTSNESKER